MDDRMNSLLQMMLKLKPSRATSLARVSSMDSFLPMDSSIVFCLDLLTGSGSGGSEVERNVAVAVVVEVAEEVEAAVDGDARDKEGEEMPRVKTEGRFEVGTEVAC